MAVCVPVKALKDTTAFSQLVENSTEPVIVTRNGREAFAAIALEQLDALRMEAARARLYRDIDCAESDFSQGHTVNARESQAKARERYGL